MLFLHESLYRTPELLARCRESRVTICGAGAIGANLAENLARAGFGRLRLIDRDRVEERNLATQPYHRSDIGAFKAKMMANSLYRAVGAEVTAETKELNAGNIDALLRGSSLVVDAFDNSTSRGLVNEWGNRTGIPCLHAGLADGYAEIIWNDYYRVPSASQDDICDYPLARNLVMLAVAVASESIVTWITEGEQRSFTITLRDLSVQPLAA